MYKPLVNKNVNMDDWQTGDLILFKHLDSCFGKMMKFFTGSEYTHVGIVLRDPTFTGHNLRG